MALTGLLTRFRCRSTNGRGRRSRRRRRTWRRRCSSYRLRPQRRQSTRRRESSRQQSTNDPIPPQPETGNAVAIERTDDVTENALQADANRSETNRLAPSSESLDINEPIISADGASLKGNERPTYSRTSISNDVIPELHQPSPSHDTIDEPIPLDDASPGEERAKKTSSNDGSFLCEVLEAVALRIASKEDPSVDEGELKNCSCEGASSKSVNSSKKCLQTVSGLTADSGYTETSVNSSKSQCGEGASNFKCTQSSRILNIDKLQAATCILDFDLPCFCVKELISDAGNFSSPDQQVQAMTASQIESDTSEDVDSGFTETSEGTTIDENSDTSDDTSSDPVDETETS